MEIERNFGCINEIMKHEYKYLASMPEYISMDILKQLSADGIKLRANYRPEEYVIDLNRLIMDRINNCQSLFPSWLNWQYLRDIFIMPDGLTEEGTKNAAAIYYKNKPWYPYHTYLNWSPSDQGNILYNDEKFVTLLYEWNKDKFTDFSKVRRINSDTKNYIHDYLDESQRLVIVVDCENSNPYKLCAALRELTTELTDKISKLILFDDIHTVNTWEILDSYVDVPIERIVIDRIKQNKSLVDIRLTAEACKEHYQNKTDSFIIVSSDSDYWGLISALPEARFFAMMEKGKCGPDIKKCLLNNGMSYCYIDDFYSGNLEDIKTGALLKQVHKKLDFSIAFNVNDMLDEVIRDARIDMSEDEKHQFYNQYLKAMHLTIDEKGNVKVELNSLK